MNPQTSIITIMRQRYSCRNYISSPLSEDLQGAITAYLQQLPAGPFQKPSRFELIASTDADRSALRGLGTYGFIKNPPAFLVGAAEDGPLAAGDRVVTLPGEKSGRVDMGYLRLSPFSPRARQVGREIF
ncbi:MAG: hypothetical protein HGA86_06670, partial [Anaerolineaceae bacterium]|nr:hypothetical protein [Anaerolineaceae bacterium]